MDELFKAVNLIKEECKRQKICRECPLYTGCGCLIDSSSPAFWKDERSIKGEEHE